MTDWSSWNPDAPYGCPPDVWAAVVNSAAAWMADPSAPRRPTRDADELYWQGRADGLALGERMPAHLVDRMVALHRPYARPAADSETPAA